MFEKEAENYSERTMTEVELEVLNTVHDWGQESLSPNERRLFNGIQDRKEAREQGFKDGAELGYNKANEWHYVKDGDLPPKTTLVLIKACGCFILGWLDDNDVWHNDSNNGTMIPKDNIYAWKEIVLPELKESK